VLRTGNEEEPRQQENSKHRKALLAASILPWGGLFVYTKGCVTLSGKEVLMSIQKLVVEIDKEMARLQQARILLSSEEIAPTTNSRRKHHIMSAAARRKISLAQRKRWREQRKAS